MTKTILVIDDEPEMIRLIDYNLTKAGYLALSATNGENGIAAVRKHAPDLVVLDVMMPGTDGLEVCKRLRGDPTTARIPILMLTAKAEESDRVLGLELGADDYVTKPFGIRELMARVKALLRRVESSSEAAELVKIGKVVIDAGRRSVTADGKAIQLTATEFNLLKALADRRGRVLSRDDLITMSRGTDAGSMDRTVDVHVGTLRRKLGKQGDMIETVRGVGYRMKE